MSYQETSTSRRTDGWSAANQRTFLEAIAEGHGVDAACAHVGLSATSAYAFRRTAKGAAFALGWRAATLVAREVVAETLMVRALHGQTDVYTRADGSTVTRLRHDNRLALGLLARLDRQVESAPDADVRAARLVAQEFDAFLALVDRDEGPARAGLFLAQRSPRLDEALAAAGDEAAPAHDLAPLYALAAADRLVRTGVAAGQDVPVADLDAARRHHWTAEQWTRAEAAGLVALAPPHAAATARASQHSQHSRGDALVWWSAELEEWRTHFPPPDDFAGEEDGFPGDHDYERALTDAEAAAMGPNPYCYGPGALAALATERDAFFAALLPPAGGQADDRAGGLNLPAGATFPHDDSVTGNASDMSIFGAIKKAIFGERGPLGGQFSGHADTPAPPPAQPAPFPQATPAPAPPPAPAAPIAPAAPPPPPPPVDVEAVLAGIQQRKGNPDLNWRTSIVDLMKLLDLDPALANRKELATELGYTGATDGSAEMNIWLHRAVMRELEKNGGTVPAALKD